uniref:Ubiquitin-like domain-containing protein n=1 Tax=Caenorhabditis tropicalis TaxID=1561998 RepID=A0A1I7U2J0_9PELO
MEISVVLILQDKKKVSHQKKPYLFNAQDTISDLSKVVKKVFNIDDIYQELFHNGEQILSLTSTFEQWGIKNDDEIVVLHSHLAWWVKYEQLVESAISGTDRIRNAREAVRLHNRLLEKGFFDVYITFNDFQLKNHNQIASYADGSLLLMKEAAKNHFRAKHFKMGAEDDSDFICRFEPRPEDLGGTRNNTLVFVKLHNEKEETKYNLKCHHFESSSDSTVGQPPDIKELFGYKLLELIQVGPHAEFVIPNNLYTTSMYIATKWNENFIPLSKIKEEELSAEILVQILLLGTILQISDLHPQNCGMWGDTKDVAIVDFQPRPRILYPDIVRAFLNNNSSTLWDVKHVDVLDQCDEETRLEIARKSLAKWDMLPKVELAYQQIQIVKNSMKKQEISFRTSPTEELEQYIRAIKHNLKRFDGI